jgi:hypothetical protein
VIFKPGVPSNLRGGATADRTGLDCKMEFAEVPRQWHDKPTPDRRIYLAQGNADLQGVRLTVAHAHQWNDARRRRQLSTMCGRSRAVCPQALPSLKTLYHRYLERDGTARKSKAQQLGKDWGAEIFLNNEDCGKRGETRLPRHGRTGARGSALRAGPA